MEYIKVFFGDVGKELYPFDLTASGSTCNILPSPIDKAVREANGFPKGFTFKSYPGNSRVAFVPSWDEKNRLMTSL